MAAVVGDQTYTLVELDNLYARLIAYAELHIAQEPIVVAAATEAAAAAPPADVKTTTSVDAKSGGGAEEEETVVAAAVVDPHNRVRYMSARSEMQVLFPLYQEFRKQTKTAVRDWEEKKGHPIPLNLDKLLVTLKMELMSWTEPWSEACERYCRTILIPRMQQILESRLLSSHQHRLIVMDLDTYVITPALTDTQTTTFLTNLKSQFNNHVLAIHCTTNQQHIGTRFRQRIQTAIQNSGSNQQQ